MLASTAVITLKSQMSTFKHLGIAQTLMEYTLVSPITSASLPQQLELAMTVSPLDLAALTYLFHLCTVVQAMESGCITVELHHINAIYIYKVDDMVTECSVVMAVWEA